MGSDGTDRGPAGQVAGRAVVRVAEGVEEAPADAREAARDALARRELADASEGEWYPLAALCAAVETVQSAAGADAVRALGRRVAAGVDLPGGCGSAAAALEVLDETYRRHHRGDAGGYSFRRIGDRDGRVECETPYPCPFDRGFVAGVAAARAAGRVRLSEVGACRAEGAPRCTYELRW